eukprot:GHRQ01038210.1.p1 GENE.GHRQ01038210.1~~GHRQ01038210.1.p1  ORF type:complete len:187 (+),score=62.62 GHRQ01038210.1:485-1045(+)
MQTCMQVAHVLVVHATVCLCYVLLQANASMLPPAAVEECRQHAWGHDEVNGLSKTPRGWFNMGLTIVDSLDTLIIAGLHEEYQEARHWVANHLQFKDGSSVQFFEVNIRILGGLLSAYYLSDGDDMYLHKAQQLGDRWVLSLVRAFWQQQQQQQRPSSFMLCAKLPEHTWGCWPTASIHRCLETGG